MQEGGSVAGWPGSPRPDPPAPVSHLPAPVPHLPAAAPDLLGSPRDWAPAATPFGSFDLVPVRLDRDLALLAQWMNDPAVAAFWELAGPDSVTAAHLRDQLDGDGRSVPCLGVLDGTPMSYWEIYRADLDPLARHYPARPHDTGVHLLIGGVADRGRGVGTTLLRAVADLILDNRPPCPRVIAEPDLRNTPSVSAFLGAGFRFHAEVDLPDKRAALMVRDRVLRNLL
ncbi:GNAT family N-acetyltransferase [Streptomyces xanthochromogenes]|uniref:GNAT family N-acetyltransferase n=1 Tax=Streptomyces xanthochromogenes TaxID=67384 RepID=UPI001677C7EC|nr:GNAT family N-acetyltransferase [Streptomyces xanthochromogenes]